MTQEEYLDLEERIRKIADANTTDPTSAVLEEVCREGTCLIGSLADDHGTTVLYQDGDSYALSLHSGEAADISVKTIPIETVKDDIGHVLIRERGTLKKSCK